MKKILVTGSNGQLGSEIKRLSGLYPDVTFLFHDIDTLDLTNGLLLENFFETNTPDYIINCAAYTAVDKAEEEPDKAFLINSEVPSRIASMAKKYNSRLIHISTDYVFNGQSYRPYTEEDTTSPVSVYGKSKLDGEQKVSGTCDAIIVRTSWLYSSFGNNFVKTILRLASQGGPVRVIYDQIGSPTCAADLASTIMQIITFTEKNSRFLTGVYHFANEGVCSWYDFAVHIVELSGKKVEIIPITTGEYPVKAQRPPYSVFNKSKIKNHFLLDIPYWQDSLKKTINELIK